MKKAPSKRQPSRTPSTSKAAQIYTGKKSNRTFEIREIARNDYELDPVADKAIKNLKKSRDSYAKAMVDLIMGILPVFNPANQVELSEQLATRVISNKIRYDQAKYLGRGKPIPGWPGNMEYQHRAATALLLLLEPHYVLHDDKPAPKVKARPSRRNRKQRR